MIIHYTRYFRVHSESKINLHNWYIHFYYFYNYVLLYNLWNCELLPRVTTSPSLFIHTVLSSYNWAKPVLELYFFRLLGTDLHLNQNTFYTVSYQWPPNIDQWACKREKVVFNFWSAAYGNEIDFFLKYKHMRCFFIITPNNCSNSCYISL